MVNVATFPPELAVVKKSPSGVADMKLELLIVTAVPFRITKKSPPWSETFPLGVVNVANDPDASHLSLPPVMPIEPTMNGSANALGVIARAVANARNPNVYLFMLFSCELPWGQLLKSQCCRACCPGKDRFSTYSRGFLTSC
jgi:hypothetical protein